mgnify:CR=1 FL=1
METKICSKCKQEKHFSDFNKNRAECKICLAQYRAANRQKIAERKAQYRATNREKELLRYARERAQKKGLEFNITVDDIVIPDRCPILGYKLKQNKGKSGKTSPSLDRIDNNKGYVKGNVRVISHRANSAKGDYTLKELKAIVKDLERLDNEKRQTRTK